MEDEIECDFCGAEVNTRSIRVVHASVQCATCAASCIAAGINSIAISARYRLHTTELFGLALYPPP
jgi:deoxycytidylate deaminase